MKDGTDRGYTLGLPGACTRAAFWPPSAAWTGMSCKTPRRLIPAPGQGGISRSVPRPYRDVSGHGTRYAGRTGSLTSTSSDLPICENCQ